MLSDIIKQIILITDGHSNQGGCPAAAAARAREAGITVSAVGILDSGTLGEQGAEEVRRVAEAGGGICHFVSAQELAYTLNCVTVQTAQFTVRHMADQQLLKLSGKSLKHLPPANRSIILPYLAQKAEEIELHMALVLDTSGSMLKKRAELEDSIKDLAMALDSRPGPVRLSVIQYPGCSGHGTMIKPPNLDNRLTIKALQKMIYGGFTPTGPAIDLAAGILSVNRGVNGIAEAVVSLR